ncbi:MAG: DUF2238 domain-containing protein [Opitutaceae bacterium]|nr:DUF2238 domain-containing protein [Opitutaceae bacterium]
MDRRLIWVFGSLAPVVTWSWIGPHDRFTWWLESAPVVVGVPLILVFRNKFPLSTLLLMLLWLHGMILVVGGHYTYAQVPLGEWAKGWFGWQRNNYDKLGHFVQGFVPAILTRELLLRLSPLGSGSLQPFDYAPGDVAASRPSRWLGFLVVCVGLAFSAFYELIEWFTAVTQGSAADDFLGTQGDPWDTQTDMLLALIGAGTAVLFFSRLHDRSLARLPAVRPRLSRIT